MRSMHSCAEAPEGSERVPEADIETPLGPGIDALAQTGDIALVGKVSDPTENAQAGIEVVACSQVDGGVAGYPTAHVIQRVYLDAVHAIAVDLAGVVEHQGCLQAF